MVAYKQQKHPSHSWGGCKSKIIMTQVQWLIGLPGSWAACLSSALARQGEDQGSHSSELYPQDLNSPKGPLPNTSTITWGLRDFSILFWGDTLGKADEGIYLLFLLFSKLKI